MSSAHRRARRRRWRVRHEAVYRRRRLGVLTGFLALVALIVIPFQAGGRPARSPRRPASLTSSRPPARKARVRVHRVLAVDGTVPDGDHGLAPGSSTVAIRFTLPLAGRTALPAITPSVAGRWVRTGRTTLAFVSARPLTPGTVLSVTVPGGPGGVRSASGSWLAETVHEQFDVEQPATERLENALARLQYLPLRPLPARSVPLRTARGGTLTVREGLGFAWTSPSVPASLASLWRPGEPGVMVKGAVMTFEFDHGLRVDGVAGPQVWAALDAALAAGETSPHPYTYVLVSEVRPETLTLWQGGRRVLTSLANTGKAGARTPIGTWPVYQRYRVQTMTGTEPDGKRYDYPDVPWVSYFTGNIAIHEFTRASYGSPQSVGCVELPPGPAFRVWNALSYGSLVTVQGPTGHAE